nr:Bm9840 [Brugia malayi]
MLPRRFQSSTFTINGYEHNIRKALRMIEEIINEECCNSHSPTYAFVPDPNVDESGTDFILCNGPIHEARYRPGREGMHRG